MAEVAVSVATTSGGRTPAVVRWRSGPWAWAVSALLMLLVLVAPALWNGFPIIFPDTGGYVTRPIEGTLELGRSAAYGLFLYSGIGLAFWPNLLAQAGLAAWLLTLTLRAYGFGGRPWLACAVVVALAVGTSLPWFTAQLMPDILFPAAVLALVLLIFRLDALARWERYALGAVVAFAIVSHMAAAALSVALIAALWLLTRFVRRALPQAELRFAAGAIAAGIALCPISNWAITGSFAFTPGGASFLFGRMLESGIIIPYLDARCPDPALRLCAYKSDLKQDGDFWLWDPNSPFRKIAPRERDAEERTIILGALKRYPLWQIRAAAEEILDQLQSFHTEVSLSDNGPTIVSLTELAPWFLPQLMSARQQKETIDVDLLNMVHMPVAAVAMIGLAGAVIFRRALGASPAFNAFAITVLLALLFNAAICATFSHSVDRYQSRLASLAVFAVLLLVIDGVRRWRRPRLGRPLDLP